jgi:hypothetical protein
MGLRNVNISDSRDGLKLKLTSEGAIPVVMHTHPPIDEDVNQLPFRQYFTSDGTADGTISMLTAAGTLANPVDFFIKAIPDFDIYIKTCAVLIADGTQTLNEWGNTNSALTNGMSFLWSSQDEGDIIINDSLKSNFDFIRLSLGQPAFGDGAAAFLASNVVSTSEAFIPTINLTNTFGLPWGIKLRANTNDKLVWQVRDDNTGPDQFDIVAYGTKVKVSGRR